MLDTWLDSCRESRGGLGQPPASLTAGAELGALCGGFGVYVGHREEKVRYSTRQFRVRFAVFWVGAVCCQGFHG